MFFISFLFCLNFFFVKICYVDWGFWALDWAQDVNSISISFYSLIWPLTVLYSSANHILGIAQNIITSYKQQNQEKRQSSALTVHCLTGSDRSGLVTLAVAAILATNNRRPIMTSKFEISVKLFKSNLFVKKKLSDVVDVWYRICSQRKSALRDINVLQLSLQIVLNNGHGILNKRE